MRVFFGDAVAGWALAAAERLACVVIATGVISLIKQHSGMDCPWDLAQLGGNRAYYSLSATQPSALQASSCRAQAPQLFTESKKFHSHAPGEGGS
jgi:membrane-associated PAP2 superfamily phosphatase